MGWLRSLQRGYRNWKFRRGVKLRLAEAKRCVSLLPILDAPPIATDPKSARKLWVLTCRNDALMACWAVYSLLRHSELSWDVVFAEDGTLTNSDVLRLRALFPNARVIAADESNKRADEMLKSYPASQRLRREFVLAKKLFDPLLYCDAERYALLDSDVLFFRNPVEWMQAWEAPLDHSNWFMRQPGLKTSFTDAESASLLGPTPLLSEVNSGVGTVHSSSIDLEFIEDCLNRSKALKTWRHILEQSLYAMLSSKHGCRFLSDDYEVDLGGAKPPSKAVCTHFVSITRDRFYTVGIDYLQKEAFLKTNWSSS